MLTYVQISSWSLKNIRLTHYQWQPAVVGTRTRWPKKVSHKVFVIEYR